MKGETLDGRVYSAVKEKIISGDYAIGAQITENRISAELGVSRTPVREALAMLARDGLVELIPNKGVVVLGISAGDLIDIYNIRKRLEGLAASLCAERINDQGIRELSDIIELSKFYLSRSDREKLEELDSNFHAHIYEYCGSRMLCKILSELHRSIGAYRRRSLENPARTEISVSEHEEILGAIKKRSSALADALMSKHVDAALKNLTEVMGEN